MLAVVTVDRPRDPRYLIQVVASILQQIYGEKGLQGGNRRMRFEGDQKPLHGSLFPGFFIFAADCFDGNISSRPELELISKLVPVLTRNSKTEPYADTSICRGLLRIYELSYCRRIIQESEDYVVLLHKASLYNPDLILAIEDDAVALPNLLPKLDRLLQSKKIIRFGFSRR